MPRSPRLGSTFRPALRTKATSLPFGDHAGAASMAGSSVILITWASGCVALTKISQLSPLGPFQLNATNSPSGDKRGCSLTPPSVVSTAILGAALEVVGGGAATPELGGPRRGASRTPAATVTTPSTAYAARLPERRARSGGPLLDGETGTSACSRSGSPLEDTAAISR